MPKDLDICKCGHAWQWHDDGEEVYNEGDKTSTFCWGGECKCKAFEHAFEGAEIVGSVGNKVRAQKCTCGHVRFMHKDTDFSCMHQACKCQFFRTFGTGAPATAPVKGENDCPEDGCTREKGHEGWCKDIAQAYWKGKSAVEAKPVVNICWCGHSEAAHGEYKVCIAEGCDCAGYIQGSSTPGTKTEFEEANAEALNQIDKGGNMGHNYRGSGGYKSSYVEEKCTVAGCGHNRTRHSLKNGKDAECLFEKCKCREYFGPNKDADVHTSDQWQGGYTYSSCGHKPQMIIDGKNWSVWAGTKHNCYDDALDFDVLLNCSNSGTITHKHKIDLPGFDKYQHGDTHEVELDWPDQGTPGLPAAFWLDLVHYLEANKKKLLAFCIGGHGRTGTAIAALMMACGYTLDEAKKHIHKNYCKKAIESKSQEKYLLEIEKVMGKLLAKEEASNDTKGKSNAGGASAG